MKKINLYIAVATYFVITNISCQAKDIINGTKEWIPLSKTATYPNSAYSMRDDVNYFELRKYVFDRKGEKQLSNKYVPYFFIYRKKLSSYPTKLINQFRKVPFNSSIPTDIKVRQNYHNYKFKAKGFIIKKDNNFWTINEAKDFIWLFDKIDTEAELHYFITVNNFFNYSYKVDNSYRKTTLGYDVKQKHIKHKVTMKSKGKYDEYTSYEEHITYLYHISSKGVITREMISKTKENEKKNIVESGFHGDPEFEEQIPIIVRLSTVLENEKFITPQ